MSPARVPGRVDRDAVAHQILDLFPQMRRRFERELPRELRDEMASVTVHQVEALCHLIDSGGLTMNELAAKQSIGLSSATALADRLLRQGLAQRTSDPHDRRIVRLVPTGTATELVQRFTEAKRRSALGALGALDDDELLAFRRLLGKIAEDPEARCDNEEKGRAGGTLSFSRTAAANDGVGEPDGTRGSAQDG